MVQARAPQIRQPRIIERPRLTRQLDECRARTILLIAPAGYGKTTLARQWLADKPHAWCALTPACRDVAALALNIATAARAVIPDAGTRMQTRLGLSPRPSEEIDVFVEMLAADLAEWPSDAWLAIDDYHTVDGVTNCNAFVESLIARAPLQVIATSRARPSWANARSRAYGLHHEVDCDALAMTKAEASQVVSNAATLDLAKGWPAVVWLAASIERFEPQVELTDSEALHAFLAEELLKNAPPKIQRSLFRLSYCPDLTLSQARRILGVARLAALLDRSARLGLVSTREGYIGMHPLVRQFLQDWHQSRDPQWDADAQHVARALMAESLWDAAYEVIEVLQDTSLLEEILAKGLMPMLEAGRHATVESWISRSRRTRADRSPWVLLAEAELASRKGDQHSSRAYALQAARVAPDSTLATRAWNLAGRSAHLTDHYDEALDSHRHAGQLATTDAERSDAIWGQLVAAWQVAPGLAGELIAALTGLGSTTIDARLRLAGAMVQDGLRHGKIRHLEDHLRESLVLASRAANPLVATSFLGTASRWLATTGHYGEALKVVDETISLAQQHRLSFVLPSALNVRAMALIGLRKWGEASRALNAAEAHAREFDDIHNEVDAHTIRLRLHTARGDLEAARKGARATWARTAGPVEMLEYRATCDLVHALVNDAEPPACSHGGATPTADVTTLMLAAGAVRSIVRQQHSRVAIKRLRTHVLTSGCADGFVVAYRACPELLVRSMQGQEGTEFHEYARLLLQRANDIKIAKLAGLQLPLDPKPELTPREREVHELLAQGLTNREIAKLLYVEEVTVKVHVRHILEKLGVRSRVEAATKIGQ